MQNQLVVISVFTPQKFENEKTPRIFAVSSCVMRFEHPGLQRPRNTKSGKATACVPGNAGAHKTGGIMS